MAPRRAHAPWGSDPPSARDRSSYAAAEPRPFWLDSPARPPARPPLTQSRECDLAIVGGGLSGLWAAVLAKQADPAREVVLLEGSRIAQAASGRNGGFFIYSLTHGIGNGMARFADEMEALEALGIENFEASLATIADAGIDCDLEVNGDILLALAPHERAWLEEEAELARGFGHRVELLDGEEMRAQVHSPIYHGGLWQRSGSATVDPAKLCWGLADLAERLGVRIHEHTQVEGLRRSGAGVVLQTGGAVVRAARVVLATSAYPALVGAARRRIVPVYDYVLVTEPLSAAQREAIGWSGRQGLGDSANQFHYYRQTADGRILWGGYDAIYNYASRLGPELEQRERSFAGLAKRFFVTFPQLEGLRFTHRWGGAIDTCSRFFAFQGRALGGRVTYTVGHTGLGVCASRFGAQVALDLADGHQTRATSLRAMSSQPIPFPPEPLRWAGIELTRNRLAAADRNQGKRGIWLRALDRFGLGFDS